MTGDFRTALRDELVSAAGRRQQQLGRRQRLAQLAMAGLGVVAVAAIAVVLTRPAPASAGVDIEVRNGQVTVLLTDLESRPDVIEEVLQEAGIDAAVIARPVGPSEVGRFLSWLVVGRESLEPIQTIDEEGETFAGFVVPVGWPGHLELEVGRAADDGESYTKPSNAFAAGEPLACTGLLHATLGEAAEALADSEVSVRVRPFGEVGPDSGPVPLARAAADRPSWRIVDGRAFSPTEALVSATEDGSPVAGRPTATEAPC